MLVEVLVATVILVTALLAAFSMLTFTTKTSYVTRAREGAVNLAREITEDARALPYWQLSNANVVSMLQTLPGLASQGSGVPWQISRRGVLYTIGATEADAQAGTMKQVTVTVSYTAFNASRTVSEVATLTSRTPGTALVATNLTMATPSVGAGNTGTATQPLITSSTVTQATFSVTAPSGTTGIIWSVGGAQQSWSAVKSGTTWTSSTAWPISGLSDGTYTIGAATQSSNGTIGPTTTLTVKLARSVPTAPTPLGYGYNTDFYVNGSATAVAEFQWQENAELNVVGYRLWNPSGTMLCQTSSAQSSQSCGSNVWCQTATACVDETPPASTSSNLTYKVAALYYDSTNTLQQGPSTNMTLAGGQSYSFTLAPTSGNTGSNCPAATTRQDALASYTLTAVLPASDNNGSDVFCADAFTAGQSVIVGGSATLYMQDSSSNSNCTVTAKLSINGATALQTATQTLLANSAGGPYTFAWPNSSLTSVSAGDRFVLAVSYSASGCSNGTHYTTLYWGSTYAPSVLNPSPVLYPFPPSAITGLSVTRNSGVATLTWTPPSGGTAVSFYRVYRDGFNYNSRYDTADTTSCTTTCSYTDPSTDTNPHTYYVSAVGGTTAGSNMGESTMSAGATG